MKELNKFILRLILLVVVLLIGYEVLLFILTPLTVYLSYLLLLPYSPSLIGNFIIIKDLTLEFIPACIAVTAYYLLSFLIILTRGLDLRKSLRLFLVGSLLILGANLIRIVFLILLLIYKNVNLFLSLHLLIWKFIAGVYVAFVWIFLVKKYKIKSIPVVGDYKYLIGLIKKR